MGHLSVIVVVCMIVCPLRTQEECTHERIEEGDIVGGLLARSLVAGTQSPPPSVTVDQATIVCLAADINANQYRGTSVVVSYRCEGSSCPAGD